jgi:aryl-alcohol dehydrogenase-like predicted oxidoreductase
MKRVLGRSGLEVSALGMGCWAIGGPWTLDAQPAGWGEVDDDESIAALHAAFDHGITFYDTAANYGAGHSERIINKAFADRRDKVVLATKFGYQVDEAAKSVTPYDDSREHGDVLSHLREECEASLRRLGTDYIDLYQLHVNRLDPELAAGVRDGLEELVSEGKIRFYAWSTDFPERLRVFAQGEHCTAVQVNMNVIHDAPAILAVCDEFDLAAINRGPLAMGMLTGKYGRDATWAADDVRTREWFQKDFFNQVLDALPKIQEVLRSGGRTLAQGALAWLWGRSERTLPIPGIRTVRQAEENAGAMRFGPLTPAQMAEIERLLDRPQPEST